MPFFSGVATDSSNKPIHGATVNIRNYGQTTPAANYSNSGLSVALTQPLTADGQGLFKFFVADGLYDIYISNANRTVTQPILTTPPTNTITADNIYVYPDPLRGIGAQTLQKAITQVNSASVNRTTPEQYGAAGDGTTDDSIAVKAAITAAGVNGVVQFTAGKTYRLTSGIRPLSGQTWLGYGSKLKRCNQITDTTSTNISAGPSSTVIAVANVSQWAVGMSVCVFNGALYDTHNHNIIAVGTSTITVDTAFTQAFASGGTIVSSFNVIDGVSVPNVKIYGLEIDGNKSNNTSLIKWELQNDIYMSGCDYLSVQDCYIHDSQCEGLQFGGVTSTVCNNTVLNTNGNGIHYSGIGGGVAAFNYVKNCNLAGAGAGHVDGCIIFSDNTNDSFICNNYCENGVCGIGSIDTDNNSNVVIQGNIIKSCTVTAIEGIFPTVSGGKVTITGNLISDSVNIKLQNTGSMSGGVGPYNWVINGNFLDNTTIYVQRAFNVTISNNQIRNAANTTGQAIFLYDVKCGLVSGNQILGYGYGVYVDGSSASLIESNLITSNVLKNQYTAGVFINDATGINVAVTNNTFQTDSGYASATYSGISMKNNTFALGNVMNLLSGQYGILCPNGAASTNGALVQGNIIRSTGITASIRCNGGSINNLISYNFVQQAISNAGTNTLTGNQTIF